MVILLTAPCLLVGRSFDFIPKRVADNAGPFQITSLVGRSVSKSFAIRSSHNRFFWWLSKDDASSGLSLSPETLI